MRLLLDTHILLWAAGRPARLSAPARTLLLDLGNELVFSAASLWEISIKQARLWSALQIDADMLRSTLLDHQYRELPITGMHALCVARLPELHRDPFDRMLVAQALSEGLTLVTSDAVVAQYPGQIRYV